MEEEQPDQYSRDEEALSRLSISELETLAVKLYKHYRKISMGLRLWMTVNHHAHSLPEFGVPPSHFDLHHILEHRRDRLNKEFVFTKETATRFAKIGDILTDGFAKALVEAVPEVEDLERRIAAGDPVLTDYEADIAIQAYFPESESEDPFEITFQNILEEFLEDSSYILRQYMRAYNKDVYTSREMDWAPVASLRVGGGMEFLEGHFIGHAVYQLWDLSIWSLPDILQIERIWVDTIITRQRSVTVTKDYSDTHTKTGRTFF